MRRIFLILLLVFLPVSASALFISPLGSDNAAITGGSASGIAVTNSTVDNTAIGGTTPAAGSFSTLTRGAVSDTEFGYLDGITSAIQTQINAKEATNSTRVFAVMIPTPTTTSNVVLFRAPVNMTLTGVYAFVADQTGKATGSASNTTTFNVSYCSSITTPTCTNVFTIAQTVSGSAVSNPSMNNTAVSAGNWVRVLVTAVSNMTASNLNVSVNYTR